jgi:diguanylate cyclase (GGDEF)-like protein
MTVSLQCFSEGEASLGAALTLGILVLQIVFGLVMRQRSSFPGRRYFLIANAGLAYWLALATLEQWTLDPGCKVWFAALTYLGIALVPLAWMMFIRRYAFGEQGPISTRSRLILLLFPTGVAAVALSSPWHGLFYAAGTGPSTDMAGGPVVYVHGPLFAINSALLYGFLVWAVVLLMRGLLMARRSYRLHFALLLLLTLPPMVANIAYVYAGFSLFRFDPTPFFFIFTSMAYAFIILTNSHLDLVGIARKDFFDNFPSAIAVVDGNGRTHFINQAAEGMMPPTEISEMLRAMVRSATLQGDDEIDAQATTTAGQAVRVKMHAVLSPMGKQHRTIGWMAVIEDVTAVQQMIAELTASLEEQSNELEQTREHSARLHSLAVRDPLTGALNRRGLEDALKTLLADGAPPNTIAIALIDIDHFKQINDSHGHLVGDTVLVRFADIMMRTFRRSDLVFRVGGEEFLVLGPDLDSQTMSQRLDQARVALAEDAQVRTAVPDKPVRFSAGLEHWEAGGSRSLADVLRSVDQLLYAAKRNGRNRTVSAEGQMTGK